MRDIEKTIGNLIDKTTISIISSVDSNGFPNTKAMLKVRKREGLKYFYFSTNTSSIRVKQYLQNNKACIYFFDRLFAFHGVMLIGEMEVLEDSESKEMIWKIGDRLYYKEGVTDPCYCVLKFTAIKGRYYTAFKSVDFEIGE